MTQDTKSEFSTRYFDLFCGITVNLHCEQAEDAPSVELTESVDAIEEALLDLSVDDAVVH